MSNGIIENWTHAEEAVSKLMRTNHNCHTQQLRTLHCTVHERAQYKHAQNLYLMGGGLEDRR